jgi:hypothetical protein
MIFACDPSKIAWIESSISRKCRTMLPPTHRTMAVIRINERACDFVTNFAA